MPLDQLGQRYAQNLFTTKLEQLSKDHSDRVSKERQDFAARGLNAGNAGFYHSRMLQLNLDHVEAVANAKADSLVEAYQRAELPIDDESVKIISQQASQWIDGQIQNVARNAKVEIARNRMGGGLEQQIDASIQHGVSGIRSRLRLKLDRLRDEQLLDARTAKLRAAPGMGAAPVGPIAQATPGLAERSSWSAWWQEWKTPAVLTAIIAIIIGAAVGLFPGEIRRHLGFDKPARQPAPATPQPSKSPDARPSHSEAVPPKELPPATNLPKSTPNASAHGVKKNVPNATVEINTPNGIAITGGTVTNPTVNNYGPPPARPAVVNICVSKSTPDNTGAIYQVVTLRTNSKIEGPKFELSFDKLLPKGTNASSPDMAMNIREGQLDSRFDFELFQTWFPGQRINVEVMTAAPVELLKEEGDHGESFVVSQGECSSGL